MLRSRETELAAIDALLAAARAGRGGGVVLYGESGIGKSTLLRQAGERAGGMCLLSTTGIETESSLGYAALQRLLRPILPFVDSVPAPQAKALAVAFRLESGDAPDRFLVSLAVLTLLSETAAERPILCLIDDAQWADGPSSEVITFVARRVETDPIALLVAIREGEGWQTDTTGMQALRLARLDTQNAAALLEERWDLGVVPSVRDALVQAAAGNPLALMELPRLLTARQLAGRDPLPEPLPVPAELERLFLSTASALEPDLQTLALLCAAEGRGSLATVTRAAANLGVQPWRLEAPGLGHLFAIDGPRITFRHPLMRSAVYQGAAPAARRVVHLALAEALSNDDEPDDRRAWHRAEAALGPDEAVAGELERSAGRTLRRSGYAASMRTLERAADLSPAEAERARRIVLAADAAWRGGDMSRARGLLERAEQLGLNDPRVRLNARYLQGAIELRAGVPADGLTLLLDAAEEAASAAPPLAQRMLALAGEAAFQAGDLEAYWRIEPLLSRLSESDDPVERLLARLLLAVNPAATREGLSDLRCDLAAAERLEDVDVLIRIAGLIFAFGEYDVARRLWTKAAGTARTSGAAGSLAGALRALALDEMARGRYIWAEASAAEGHALALETGQPNLACQHAAILAEVAGLRGDEQEARSLADAVLREATGRGLHGTVALVRRALGQLTLAWGRPEEAIDHLEALWELSASSHRAIAFAVIPDLVEAGVRAGRQALAQQWLSRLPHIPQNGSPDIRALALRSQALLASPGEADLLFQEALQAYTTTERPLEQARTTLLYGEYLRRGRRRLDARESLRVALATFERLGAVPWVERARSELRATGETARRRDSSSFGQLTRQELQVVRVVSQGATNREAAAQLFISPRTVDHHLRSIFEKLGISSRSELIRLALAGDQLGTS